MRAKSLGAFLLLGLTLASAGQDKGKKAIEVVYDDVQILKQQVQELRALLDQNSAEIRSIQEQLKAIADLVRQAMAGQAGLQEGLRAVPAQYQDIVHKIDLLTLDVQKVAADLAAARDRRSLRSANSGGRLAKP